MTRFLAWDTSAKSGTLVAFESTLPGNELKLIAEFTLNVDATHSERLLWAIHQVLESARWTLSDIDVLGVGVGPGSFTGLRIGLTTARTLAHSLQKPLVGVSSLAALARPVAHALAHTDQGSRTLLVTVTDACKGELFALWGPASKVGKCALFPSGQNQGVWEAEVKEQVIEPAHLIERLEKELAALNHVEARWLAVGEGRSRYLEEWRKGFLKESEMQSPICYSNQIQGRALGTLVWEAYQAGTGCGGLELLPRYLRASNAEILLQSRL